MNVLLTGANSYLGGWVVHELDARGHTIYPLNSHGQPTPIYTRSRGQHYNWLPKQSIICGGGYKNLDAIIHLGWHSKAGDTSSGEICMQGVCLSNTVDLVHAAVTHCPHAKLIFASTASVYGNLSGERESLETDLPAPTCAYTRAKVEAERLILSTFPQGGLVVRMGSLMGVGSEHGRTKLDVIVNAFAHDGYRTGRIEVWSPFAYKPILHVQDAARIIVEGIERRDWVGVVNAAATSLRALDIAALAAYHTGAVLGVVEGRTSPRSCRLGCYRLREELPDLKLKGLGDTICEFRSYYPSQRDATIEWT